MTTIQFTDLIEPVLHVHMLGRTIFVESGGFMVAPNTRRINDITVYACENHGILFQKEDEVVAAVTLWDPEMVAQLASPSLLEPSLFQERLQKMKGKGAIVAMGNFNFFMEELQDAQKAYESE